jgi:hypothetical protein
MRWALGAAVMALVRFLRDFLVGDDWRIAAGVGAVLGAAMLVVWRGALPDMAVGPLVAVALMAILLRSVARRP